MRAFVRVLLGLGYAVWILTDAAPARAQVGERVVEIVIEQEGQRVTEPTITRLIQTRVGEPLSIADVRETTDHLYSLRRFDDVQTSSEPVPNGIRLRYTLFPLHPIDRIEFRGTLGLSQGSLRTLVVDRFGDSPRSGQLVEVAEALRAEYRRKGYDRASITPRVEESHNPDRATLVIDVQSGPRQTITDVRFTHVDPERSVKIEELPDVKRGQPFDEDAIESELRAWEERMRARDYYEATASHGSITGDGIFVTVSLALGPRVVLGFAGDPLPKSELEQLVPIRAEGSADEDLLEDSRRAIEAYLSARGYRDAAAPVSREERGGDLIITFDV
ncbi:MAG TPA: POTRA domain-containing protein, partial [Vicinamibacterales bacterium]|nr:POTRA domain-containing protein [Vicinamibacterales bacterium]